MDEAMVFKIYKLIRKQETTWLNLHSQYYRQYVTLIIVMLGVLLGEFYKFKNESWFWFAILITAVLNNLLCIIGIRMCNRFYQRFLEGVTIQAKLESLIGLTKDRSDPTEHPDFSEDKKIFPERWSRGRSDYKQAEDFVEAKMNAGSNLLVQLTFLILCVINIVVALIISRPSSVSP